jgi:hypothetical protein
MGIEGTYLTGEQQCELSLTFGNGELHSTHGNHEECPNRDIFRLSNNPEHGFNEVGPEWHNDGSFERNVFSYVVYHIIKAPEGPGHTAFAHLGKAFDALPPERKALLEKCASVNSNSGVVHPLVHSHSISGRRSLYLHTGMTGSIMERVADAEPGKKLSGIKAWNHDEMNSLFIELTELLEGHQLRPQLAGGRCDRHRQPGRGTQGHARGAQGLFWSPDSAPHDLFGRGTFGSSARAELSYQPRHQQAVPFQ